MKRSVEKKWLSLRLAALIPVLLAVSELDAGNAPEGERHPILGLSEAVTLEDALRLAAGNNPELQAAMDRTEAAAGRARQAGLWDNPSLNLNAEEWPVSGGGGFNDAKQTVGISQTVPFPGKRRLERAIGTTGLEQTAVALELRRRELVREVTSAYYRTLAAQNLVTVAGDLVSVAESSANYARERVRAGAAADQEQLRAEISLEQARAELEGFRQQQATAHQLLVQFLGDTTFIEHQLSGVLPETADLDKLNRPPETWLLRHPELIMAETGQKQADLQLKRAGLKPYPDVTVALAGGRLGDTSQSIVELGLTIPLPLIDTSRGDRQEAAANVRVAEAERLAAEIRLLTEWRSACVRFRTAAGQVDTYRDRILPRANEALRLVRTGFEEGKFGFIDLLDTQRTAAEVRLSYQHRLLELGLAQAEIEYFTGRPAPAATTSLRSTNP